MRNKKHKIFILSGEEVSEVPDQIKILPLGHVTTTKGDFFVDDESVRLIISMFKNRKLDLVIDYEHQTLEDIQAPASGWIKELYKGEDAIIAKVEWTDKAREYLRNKEYRYLSPVVLTRVTDKKAIALHSVALTNTPAVDGMFAIINSDDLENIDIDEIEGEMKMELMKLIKLLGLEESATEEDVEKKLAEVVSKVTGEAAAEELVANKTILDLLELDAEAKTADVAACIMALKTPAEDTQKRLRELEKESKERVAVELVTMALKEGKIAAAQKDWAKNYAMADKDGFKLFISKAPTVVPVGKVNYAGEKKKIAEVDLNICKNIGVSEIDIKKYLGGNEDE